MSSEQVSRTRPANARPADARARTRKAARASVRRDRASDPGPAAAQRLNRALAALEKLAPEAREPALEAVRALVDLYGRALDRILTRLHEADRPLRPADLASDELVGHLLLLHELHPDGYRDGRAPLVSPVVPPISHATAGARSPAAETLRCDLCGEAVAEPHRHLLDMEDRRLRCACQACSLLLGERGGERYRAVPDRLIPIDDLDLPAPLGREIAGPLQLTFMVQAGRTGAVAALYPGPAGVTEALLDPRSWSELVRRNPVLRQIEPDVEALLLDRRGESRAWLAPVDLCYRLAGAIRESWQGPDGGEMLRQRIAAFFNALVEPGTRRANAQRSESWR